MAKKWRRYIPERLLSRNFSSPDVTQYRLAKDISVPAVV
jgi:hypothetical protein